LCSATDSNRAASARNAQRPLNQNHRNSSIRLTMSNFAFSMPKNRRNCLKTSTDQYRKIFVNKRLTMRRGAFIQNRQGLLSRRAEGTYNSILRELRSKRVPVEPRQLRGHRRASHGSFPRKRGPHALSKHPPRVRATLLNIVYFRSSNAAEKQTSKLKLKVVIRVKPS